MKMDSSDRTSTQQFLIHCLRVFLKSEGVSSLKTYPADSVDWDVLLRLASQHKVVPLLHRSLQENHMNVVPETVARGLLTLCRSVSGRNLLLTGELVRLLKLFEANGIASIPLKGPALAFFLYGDPALRQSVDIDILVQEEDYRASKRLLVSIGYQPQYPLTRRQEKSYMKSTNHEAFTTDRNGMRINVELHYCIRRRDLSFHPDIEGMFERSVSDSIAGTRVKIFSHEDLLSYLCAHGAQHQWRCLQWLCDLAQLLRIYTTIIEWDMVMQQAKTSGAQRMLFLGLFLTNNILGAPIPYEILKRIKQDPLTIKLAGQVKQRLSGGTLIIPGIQESMMFKSQLMGKNEIDCFLYFIRDFSRRITTPTPADWKSIPLPDTLFPLYYVVRPIRLSAKYGKKAVNYIYNNLCRGK